MNVRYAHTLLAPSLNGSPIGVLLNVAQYARDSAASKQATGRDVGHNVQEALGRPSRAPGPIFV